MLQGTKRGSLWYFPAILCINSFIITIIVHYLGLLGIFVAIIATCFSTVALYEFAHWWDKTFNNGESA